MANIIDMLTNDHRAVEALFEQGPSASAAIVAALRQHDQLETKLLYPAAAAAGVDVGHAKDEHEAMRALLGRVEANEGDAFDDLRTALADHVKEEEDELFPALREAVSTAQLAELGEHAQILKAPLTQK